MPLYADDCKLFKEIKSLNDACELQRDLDSILNWAKSNSLKLNIKKCNFISFYRTKNFIDFQYTLNNEFLNRVQKVKDLGILYDSKLTFDEHIRDVVARASGTLGFIIRSTSKF